MKGAKLTRIQVSNWWLETEYIVSFIQIKIFLLALFKRQVFTLHGDLSSHDISLEIWAHCHLILILEMVKFSKNSPASHTPLPEYETLCRIYGQPVRFYTKKGFYLYYSCFLSFLLLSQMFPFDNRSQLQPSPPSSFLSFSHKGKISKGLW